MIEEGVKQGEYLKDIAAELGVHPRTVRRLLVRGSVPPGKRPGAWRSKLDPYKPTVDQWLAEGVWNGVVVWRELQAQGFTGGGLHLVRLHLAQAGAASGPGEGAN